MGFDYVGNVVPMGSEVRGIAQAWGDGHLGVDDATSVVSLGMNGLGLFLDPVNWVVGKLIGPIIDWILSAVPPCKQAMDFVTGKVDAVHGWAEGFQHASEQTAQGAIALVQQANASLAQWQGPGAEAYREAQRSAIDLQRSIADRQHTIYTVAYALGGLVAAVKEIVVGLIKELITDLVTKGILAAAAAIPSLGSAIAAYMAWAAGKYALVMGKVAKWFQKLFTKASEMTSKVKVLSELFDRIGQAFGRLASKFDAMAAQAAKAADKADQARGHQDRMEDRQDRAAQHRENADNSRGRERRTEDRQADTQDRRAAEQRDKMTDANRESHRTREEAGAGASTGTKVVVGEGGKGYDDSTERHPYDTNNPADSIPDF